MKEALQYAIYKNRFDLIVLPFPERYFFKSQNSELKSQINPDDQNSKSQTF
jgi:hypothetical protein